MDLHSSYKMGVQCPVIFLDHFASCDFGLALKS